MTARTRDEVADGEAATGALIRSATTSDIDAVTAIERVAFGDPWSRNAFASLVANPAVMFQVAVAPAALAGVAVLGYVVAWFAADEAEIGNIAVCPSARGRKLGARLLDVALGEAVRRGAATTYLEVRESNIAARRLYASRGFAVLGRRRGYYRHPVEDALVLGRSTAVAVEPRHAG